MKGLWNSIGNHDEVEERRKREKKGAKTPTFKKRIRKSYKSLKKRWIDKESQRERKKERKREKESEIEREWEEREREDM